MDTGRKPFQGVVNIIRFNYPFYAVTLLVALLLVTAALVLPDSWALLAWVAVSLFMFGLLVSLIVSAYVYDLSGLYTFRWLRTQPQADELVVNIHAGFDETSQLLQAQLGIQHLHIFDFYNPSTHTEPAIKRARALYPAPAQTQVITTQSIPLADQSTDHVFVLFAAHEIRNDQERAVFFQEVKRILKPTGKVLVVEHVRDTANFLAYNLGALHFLSSKRWQTTWEQAGLHSDDTYSINPFVTAFVLSPYGNLPAH